jgi:hypothetical protein
MFNIRFETLLKFELNAFYISLVNAKNINIVMISASF